MSRTNNYRSLNYKETTNERVYIIYLTHTHTTCTTPLDLKCEQPTITILTKSQLFMR